MSAFHGSVQDVELGDDGGPAGEASAPAFRLVQRRFGRFCGVSLCPSMDLLCVSEDSKAGAPRSGASGSIDLHRSISWDRLSEAPVDLQSGECTAIAWSPDGREVAVGASSGALAVLDVERGDVRQLERTGSSAVLQLYWCAAASPERSLAERLAAGMRHQLAEALPSAAIPNDLSVSDSQQQEQAQADQPKPESPTLLLSMDASGVFRAYCGAEVAVLEVDLRQAFAGVGPSEAPDDVFVRPVKANASPDISEVYALVSVLRRGGREAQTLHALRIPIRHVTDHMGGRSEILLHVARAREDAQTALQTAREALANAFRSTEASCRSLGGKFTLLLKLLRDYALVQAAEDEPPAVTEARAIKAAFAEYVRFGEGAASGPAIAAFFGQSWTAGTELGC
eukprot:scaffold425_cov373-Pinguiococcus_pyrenoidosus.AAC.10